MFRFSTLLEQCFITSRINMNNIQYLKKIFLPNYTKNSTIVIENFCSRKHQKKRLRKWDGTLIHKLRVFPGYVKKRKLCKIFIKNHNYTYKNKNQSANEKDLKQQTFGQIINHVCLYPSAHYAISHKNLILNDNFSHDKKK